MKHIVLFCSILVLLALAACTLPVPTSEAPTTLAPVTDTAGLEPTSPVIPTEPAPSPVVTEAAPPPTEAAPLAAPTETPLSGKPTAKPTTSQPTASQPTVTKEAAAASPTPAPTFVPTATLGEPSYHNPMEVPNYAEWAKAGTKTLPDDDNIRLQFKEGELYVTGKQLDFSTWWFSYHTLKDAYIEMAFNSEACSGDDAYGMIFRGPPHKAGQSYGYVVSLSCDGKLWVFRLDGINPWRIENLIEPKEVSAIKDGSGQENVVGVYADGDDMTIYVNGKPVGEVQDDHFSSGRVGVFVRSASPDVYTYRMTDFIYWILNQEE